MIKATKEEVAKLSTEMKIKLFCNLLKSIDLDQKDIDENLSHGRD